MFRPVRPMAVPGAKSDCIMRGNMSMACTLAYLRELCITEESVSGRLLQLADTVCVDWIYQTTNRDNGVFLSPGPQYEKVRHAWECLIFRGKQYHKVGPKKRIVLHFRPQG